MRNVSRDCIEAFNKNKRDLRFKIEILDSVITDDNIIDFNIEDAITMDDDFTLGGTVASRFKVNIKNVGLRYTVEDFKGKTLKVYIGILLPNGSIEYTLVGKYNIEDVNLNDKNIEIDAMDNMVKFEKEYNSKLEYPCTAKSMLQEICSSCGVELVNRTYLNEDYVIEKPVLEDSCREVLHDLAMLFGGFAKINNEGLLDIITPVNTDLEINKDNYIELQIKESFRIDNYSITETYFPSDAIPLNINICPFTAKWFGNIALEVGDKVRVNDDVKCEDTIITRQKVIFNGGLTFESECSGLSEQQKNTQSVNNQTKLNRRFASEIKQNAEEILLRVTAEGVETLVKQNADSWELSINGKLTGRTYRFDGEGFTLGGTEDDVAKHTPSSSEWNFKNGGKARVDENGFYFQHGESKNEYHSLIKVYEQQVNTSGIGNTFDFNITLPSEFKGKNFLIIPMITDAVSQENNGKTLYISGRHGAWVKNINKAAGTFNVYGQYIAFKVITTNEFGGIVDLEKMYYGRSKSDPQVLPLKLNISILVIA
ncbi:MAG: hypothetical protein E6X34_14315 [Clostridium sp.]|uniref:hypothetical protein n=1 Tax=Clostridium sp. TaxID=1506 RepID=UPI0029133149|nr:hypothetical protein [Clostridium sp.]MDU4939623.1 hypothetical protein [Clostridium sp.]